MNRRNFAKLAAGVSLAAPVAACTTSNVNGVSTVTLNVAETVAWGQAVANAAVLFAGFPGVPASVSTTMTTLAGLISADLTAFKAAAGNSVTLSFAATSPNAAVTSLLNDGQTVLTDASGVVKGVAAQYLAQAQTALNSLKTIMSIFQAVMAGASVGTARLVVGAAAHGMTEQGALLNLGVVYQ